MSNYSLSFFLPSFVPSFLPSFFSFLSLFLIFVFSTKDITGWSCTFLAPALESTITQRVSDPFLWRRVFRSQDLGSALIVITYCCPQAFSIGLC
jgi:hypothetical protein